MKILHLIYTNGIAGAEKYLRHLLPPLKAHGIQPHLIIVCSPGFEGPLKKYCDESNAVGIPTRLIIASRFGFVKAAWSISRYLSTHRIKYIHSHLLNSDVLATLVKTIFNRKVIIISTKHGYKESILKQIPSRENMSALKIEAAGEVYYKVTRWVVKHAAYNYAVSKAISNLYYELGLTKAAMPFIHHGVTVPGKRNNMEGYRFAPHQLIIVGRLEEFKGHNYLVRALPAVLANFPDCKLVIIGEGSQEINLKSLSRELGIEEKIMFLGFNNDPYSYVSSSDVIILPSLFEPFGLVYIEAFALKVPVVAFDTPAGNEIMQNETTALLVPPRDVAALAEKIIYLLSNPAIRRDLAERAHAAYLQTYSTERMVQDTADFYLSL